MRFKFLVLALFVSQSAFAGVYKCTDDSGNTRYQSKPCVTGENVSEINFKTGEAINKEGQRTKLNEEMEKQRMLEEQAKLEAERKEQRRLGEAAEEREKNQELIKNNPEQFTPFAIPPYDPGNLSDLVKTFEDRLPDIERLRRLAALKALSSAQCNRVEASELNVKSTYEQLVFLVNCSRGQGVYFNENELR
ncbi:MAG: DUF4124 domain-containing protein [Gammaproteobacteria bacterium]